MFTAQNTIHRYFSNLSLQKHLYQFGGEINSSIENTMENKNEKEKPEGLDNTEKRTQGVLDLLDVSKNSKLKDNPIIQQQLQKLVLKSIQNTPDATEIWQMSMFDTDGEKGLDSKEFAEYLKYLENRVDTILGEEIKENQESKELQELSEYFGVNKEFQDLQKELSESLEFTLI
jgi:hypothetical protein